MGNKLTNFRRHDVILEKIIKKQHSASKMYLMAFLIVKKHTFAVLALRIIVFLLDGLGIEVGVI